MKRQSEERHRLLEAARQLQGEILPALLAEVEARRLTVVGAAALLGVNHSVVSGMISRARRRAERSLDAARLATAADLEAAERRREGI
jgi:hypothetical protein